MKKFKLFTITLAVIMLFSVMFMAVKSNATELEVDEKEKAQVQSASEEDGLETIGGTPDIYKGDLYVAFGEDDLNSTSYVMDKYVDGNVFIFGNDVTITGQINGSLFVCASKVKIDEDAYIVCHTFVAAQEFEMSGVTTDMYAACGNFNFDSQGVVSRDLKLATTNAVLRGSVGRDVDMAASSIDLYEDEENSFFVGGNLKYTSGSEAEHIDDIIVKGEITYTQENNEEEDSNKIVLGDIALGAIKNIVFTLVIYLLLIFLAPKFIQKSREYAGTRALLSGAIGLAFTIIIPIVSFVLLFTVVGVSAAVLAVLIYVIVLMINSAIVTVAVNELIVNKFEMLNSTWKKILMIIPVSLVIYLIKQIPYIGGLISVIIFFVGVGISILYQFDKRKKEEE